MDYDLDRSPDGAVRRVFIAGFVTSWTFYESYKCIIVPHVFLIFLSDCTDPARRMLMVRVLIHCVPPPQLYWTAYHGSNGRRPGLSRPSNIFCYQVDTEGALVSLRTARSRVRALGP